MEEPDFSSLSVLIGRRASLPPIQHLTRYFGRKLIERACHVQHQQHSSIVASVDDGYAGDDDAASAVDDTDGNVHSTTTQRRLSSRCSTSSSSTAEQHAPRKTILDEYALIDHGRRLTFGQFRRCYRRLAHLFSTTLVPANKKQHQCHHQPPADAAVVVGVAMQPSIELVVTLFGLLEAECMFVPVDTTLPDERLRAILADANVSFIICDRYAMQRSDDLKALVKNVYQFNNLVASGGDISADGYDTPINAELLKAVLGGSDSSTMLDEMANEQNKDEMHHDEVISTQLAAILYTSGSTGTPKGVPLSHAALMNMVQWRMKEMPFWHDEIGVMKSVFTFIDGIIEIFEALLQLRPLVLLTKADTIDPATLLSTLSRHKIYRLAIVPSHLATLVQHIDLQQPHERQRNALRIIVCDGEVLPPRTVRQALRCFPGVKIYNIYGSTETTGDNTYVCIDDERQLDDLVFSSSNATTSSSEHAALERIMSSSVPSTTTMMMSPPSQNESSPHNSGANSGSVVPSGHPCDNVNVYIVSADGTLTAKGEVGEVYISGIAVANSYIGGTMDKFIPNHLVPNPLQHHSVLYCTGDVGYVSPTNNMVYLPGRREDLVKIRGQRIHLAEVNAAIMSLPQVNECVTLTEKTFVQTKLLSFFTIQLPGTKTVSAEAEHDVIQRLEEVLKHRLPYYALPVLIPYTRTRQLPRMANGKIDKVTLTKYYNSSSLHADETDKSVMGIIASVLGVPLTKLERNKDFFENGGNSLNAISTVNKLRQYGHYFTVTDFLQCRSLNEVEEKCALHSSPSPPHAAGENSETTRDEYLFIPLGEIDAEAAASQIYTSYETMGDWERYVDSPDRDTYVHEFMKSWPDLVAQNMSFGVVKKDNADDLVSISLSYDANRPFTLTHDDGEEEHPFFAMETEILDEIMAKSVLAQLPQEPGKVWFAFSDSTTTAISDAEKVRLMWLMQVEQVRRARALGYYCIVANNTSPVTQGVGQQLGYKTMKALRIKDIVLANGKRPFADASDDHISQVDVLFLQPEQK